jgi:hypothetical protein
VLSVPRRELGGYVIASRDAVKPEQEKVFNARLANKAIVYTAKQETFITIDKTEYDKKIAPIIEKIEAIGRGTPASPRTEVDH